MKANWIVAFSVAMTLAAGGVGAAAAFSARSAPSPSRTVTVTLKNGEQGPVGPAGPKGEKGDPGESGIVDCPKGFGPADLVINHPGGHVTIYTCLKD